MSASPACRVWWTLGSLFRYFRQRLAAPTLPSWRNVNSVKMSQRHVIARRSRKLPEDMRLIVPQQYDAYLVVVTLYDIPRS